jgi:hypothetical protein
VFFWFIGTAIMSVGLVFRDPRFDYRLLIVGSVIPIGDGIFGGSKALHSVTVAILLLALLMVATAGRKPIRKMLLGLPIGMILHLVFDGAWNNTSVFWWPFFGVTFDDSRLPVIDRGLWGIPFEIVGIVLCVWLWRHNDFSDAARRRQFLRDGELDAVPERFA